MRLDVVTIFADYLAPLQLSLIGKAQAQGLLDLRVHDLREHTHDRHRTVDAPPYGGGAGLLMAAEPWLAFACGRYEGIDARVVEHYRTRIRVREVSLGDYVLNGGEVAVLAITEAVARLLPGVIGNAASLTEESHAPEHDGLLEHPAYTKPASWRGLDVPAVLAGGNHGAVDRWRRDEALRRTADRRPDVIGSLDPARCDRHDLTLLSELGWIPDDHRFRRQAPAVAD